jgi:hypothetical protein
VLGYYMPVSFCLSLPPCVVCAVLRCRWFFNKLLKQNPISLCIGVHLKIRNYI